MDIHFNPVDSEEGEVIEFGDIEKELYRHATQPNETKEISIEIINHVDTSEILEVQLNRDITNRNRFIDYRIDGRLTVDFNSLVDNLSCLFIGHFEAEKEVIAQCLKCQRAIYENSKT